VERRKRYSRKFQRMAVERMTCESVDELARELGVVPRCLYKWRTKLEASVHVPERCIAASIFEVSNCDLAEQKECPYKTLEGCSAELQFSFFTLNVTTHCLSG
jgi:transposase-like protein